MMRRLSGADRSTLRSFAASLEGTHEGAGAAPPAAVEAGTEKRQLLSAVLVAEARARQLPQAYAIHHVAAASAAAAVATRDAEGGWELLPRSEACGDELASDDQVKGGDRRRRRN